jgi:hypothetical protein
LQLFSTLAASRMICRSLGSADVAASSLGECLGGIGEAVAGGDRNLKLPVPESLREFP